MGKYAVVYWSGTGNTEAMAEEIAEGIRAEGKQAELFTAAEFSDGQVAEYDGIAFGCPSMGAEELESEEFAPMFEAVLPLLKEKKVALFGSYGWGDGEWMRNWQADIAEAVSYTHLDVYKRQHVFYPYTHFAVIIRKALG